MDPFLIVAILFCVALVVGLQFRSFGTAGKSRTATNLASFFEVHEITEKWQRNILAIVAASPFSFAFFLLARDSKSIALTLLEYQAALDKDWNEITVIFKGAPEAFFPFVLLVLLFLLFGAQLKFLFQSYDKSLVYIVGLGPRTNRVARNFADFLVREYGYRKTQERLERSEKTGKRLPLPEELENADEEQRIAFQLLHLAKPVTGERGLKESLVHVINSRFPELKDNSDYQNLCGPIPSRFGIAVSRLSDVKWSHVFVGLIMFIIVCGLYIAIVPMAQNYFSINEASWPHRDEMSSLVYNVLLVSLGTTFAMVAGILLYAKRADEEGKMSRQALMGVITIVFLLSLMIHLPGMVLLRFEYAIGLLIGEASEYFGFPEFVYILTHSLIPCLGVLVLVVVDPKDILSRWDILVMIVVVSIGHIFAYAAYEISANVDWKYYWHQGLLAAVVNGSALAILSTFWKAPDRADTAASSESAD